MYIQITNIINLKFKIYTEKTNNLNNHLKYTVNLLYVKE